jgi:hypothetical protein
MSIGNLTAIFSETHSPLKKNEEINKKTFKQTNRQTKQQKACYIVFNIYIRLNIKLALSCKFLNSNVKLWMVDLVETIKMCNAI